MRRAHTFQIARLEYAQQFSLLPQRYIGNLIQEKGAPIGELEAPDAVRTRVGKRSFDMAEELALKGSLSQRAGVHCDQRARRARRERMQRLRHDFFARAMLAGNEHVGIRRADAR